MHRCFHVNLTKFSRTPFSIKQLWWLLPHLWNIFFLIKSVNCHEVRTVFSNILEIFFPNNIIIDFLKIIDLRKVVAYTRTEFSTAWKVSKCGVFPVRIFLYSVRIQENTDRKNLGIWTFFTQYSLLNAYDLMKYLMK